MTCMRVPQVMAYVGPATFLRAALPSAGYTGLFQVQRAFSRAGNSIFVPLDPLPLPL